MASGAGACARKGEANAVAAIAPEPLSRLRLEMCNLVMACLRYLERGSHTEQLRIPRLDGIALLLDRGSILLHGLERAERTPPVGLLDLRVHRAQLADVDHELLAIRREAEQLEQSCRVRVR